MWVRAAERKLMLTFKISDELDAKMAARAKQEGVPKTELARRFVTNLLRLKPASINLDEPDEVVSAKRYYLEQTQDKLLEDLSTMLSVHKSRMFRIALRRGLAGSVEGGLT